MFFFDMWLFRRDFREGIVSCRDVYFMGFVFFEVIIVESRVYLFLD